MSQLRSADARANADGGLSTTRLVRFLAGSAGRVLSRSASASRVSAEVLFGLTAALKEDPAARVLRREIDAVDRALVELHSRLDEVWWTDGAESPAAELQMLGEIVGRELAVTGVVLSGRRLAYRALERPIDVGSVTFLSSGDVIRFDDCARFERSGSWKGATLSWDRDFELRFPAARVDVFRGEGSAVGHARGKTFVVELDAANADHVRLELRRPKEDRARSTVELSTGPLRVGGGLELSVTEAEMVNLEVRLGDNEPFWCSVLREEEADV